MPKVFYLCLSPFLPSQCESLSPSGTNKIQNTDIIKMKAELQQDIYLLLCARISILHVLVSKIKIIKPYGD